MTEPAVETEPHVWEDGGIVHTRYPPAARVTLEMAKQTFAHRRELLARSGQQRHRIMIIGTRITAFDYGAYRFSAGHEVSSTVTAAALVCTSTLERHLCSLFVNMFRPRYPVRIFDNMDSARHWLETFSDT